MSTRDKITVLTNVKNAILSKIVPITEDLLSRLEAVGVNLTGYRNNMGNVPIKEENKVVEMPKQLVLKQTDDRKAA